MAELGSAYVTIIPSLEGATKTIQKELSGIDVSGAGTKMGNSLGSSMGQGISNASKVIVTAIGSIGGAIGAIAATGGMARALNMEKAQTMFEGLKLSWADYSETVQGAVAGTAFAMDEAAVIAANLAASGITSTDQLKTVLDACVGTAATFGTSLSDIGGIFQKVAAKGKLSGDELLQLNTRGVNALAILSEQLGLTQEEVSEMVTKGKIDFETFANAMNAAFGEAGAAANKTFTGSLANMKSALNRIGQDFATPLIESCVPLFNALRLAIDAVHVAMKPLIEAFAEFIAKISSGLVDKIQAFTNALDEGQSIFGAFVTALGPAGAVIAIIVTGIVALGAAFGALSTAAAVIPGVSGLIGAISGGAGVYALATNAVNLLSAAFTGVGLPITITIGLFAALMKVSEDFRNAISNVGNSFSEAFAGIADLASTLLPYLKNSFESVKSSIVGVLNDIAAVAAPIIIEVGNNFASTFQKIGEYVVIAFRRIGDAFASIVSYVSPVVSVLASALIPILGSVLDAVSTIAGAISGVLFTALTYVLNLLVSFVGAVMPPIIDFLSNFLPMASGLIQEVVGAITNLAEELCNRFQPILRGIHDRIQEWMPAIQEAMSTAFNAILEVVQSVWPTVQQIISGAIEVISTMMHAVLNVVEFVWPIIATIVETVCDTIKGIIETVWPYIKGIIENAMNAIQSVVQIVLGIINGDWGSVWQGICSFVENIWGIITNVISGATSLIGSAISSALDNIAAIWNSIWSAVSSFVSQTWNDVTSAVSNGVGSVLEWVGSLPDRILGLFSDAGSWLIDSGRSIIEGLVNGIKGAIDWAAGVVGDALGAIRNLFPFSPAKEGPFSGRGWVKYSGISIMKGLAEGAEEASAATLKTFSALSSDVRNAFDLGDLESNADYKVSHELTSAPSFSNDLPDESNSNDFMAQLLEVFTSPDNNPVNLYLDGKLVASTLAPNMDQALALQASRRGR